MLTNDDLYNEQGGAIPSPQTIRNTPTVNGAVARGWAAAILSTTWFDGHPFWRVVRSRRWAGLALLNPSAVRLRYRLGGAICCRFSVVFRQFRGTVLAESLTTFGFYLICFAQGIIGAWFFDALLLSFAGIVVEHYKVWILYLKLMNVALTMMNSVIKMSDFARNSGMWKTWLRGSC